MTIGLGEDVSGVECPVIALFYSEEVFPGVLRVLGEMEKRELFPEVYFNNKGRTTYVVAVFRLKLAFDFLKEIAPEKYAELVVQETAGEELELVMAADSNLSTDAIQRFIDAFKNKGYFRLFIMKEGIEEAQWGVQVPSFAEGLPVELQRGGNKVDLE